MSTAYGGLARFLGAAVTATATAGACGDDAGGAIDAGAGDAELDVPDAEAPDAAPVVLGRWRVVSDTTAVDPTTANGILELSSAGDLALGVIHVESGHVDEAAGHELLATYSLGAETLTIGGADPIPVGWEPTPERLTLDMSPAETLVLERYEHAASTTMTVQGTASVGDDVGVDMFAPLAHPRAAIAFLLRDKNGAVGFILVPDANVALTNFGQNAAQTAPIDLSRTEGALGVERITFGAAFIAIGLVVVYDDVDDDGLLGSLYFSCGPGDDCVRGVSPTVLAYRFGSSSHLDDSAFKFLLEKWSLARLAADQRYDGARTGLVPLDPTGAPIPVDVVITEDAVAAQVPWLMLF